MADIEKARSLTRQIEAEAKAPETGEDAVGAGRKLERIVKLAIDLRKALRPEEDEA